MGEGEGTEKEMSVTEKGRARERDGKRLCVSEAARDTRLSVEKCVASVEKSRALRGTQE